MPNFKSILHKKTYALTFRVADYNKKLKLEMNNFQNGKSMFKIRWQCQCQASVIQWDSFFKFLINAMSAKITHHSLWLVIRAEICWMRSS